MEKKTKGRKRHIITDTQSHILAIGIHAANIHDTVAGPSIIEKVCEQYPSIQAICGDAGYRKTTKNYVENIRKLRMDISQKIAQKGWNVIPKRWAVERAFAWLNNSRRLSKDYETNPVSSENFVMVSHAMTILARFSTP